MSYEDEFDETEPEEGSDNLLADDQLRLPENANILVRIHAVRAWLDRRQREIKLAIGQSALKMQYIMEEEDERPRRRRTQVDSLQQIQQLQQAIQDAQEQLQMFEDAAMLLQECVDHHTSGEGTLVEYYLLLEDALLQVEDHPAQVEALSEVIRRVEHVSAPDLD
ncbi:hypothetical protein EI42_00496 [Thermosporothrix hazakensis]|jgi:predicted RNase H-like nuclease (RuvC/YqgF family)|uniref:Uncharacterized protein n=2 Tax=Thermosporothrix TaxID=768650 RepID=A0A326UCH9_THEHA|nr:hypothetical protein [Thermosporothrix hazakensis]PZW36322.1 hypothetical protein EI42_00496 [Thermosporothrix hazakensis]BBH88788.1 hypothetical protein KTC_35390 [Thermosporothrix sp. COM3]GCE46971.1 hypothetical protein KTH_18400 [Thermosporothrix hazakensis]